MIIKLLIIFTLLSNFSSLAQANKGKVRKEKMSFGEVWFIEKHDDTIGDEGEQYNKEGIVEGSTYHANGKKFYSSEIQRLFEANELSFIWTNNCELIQGMLINFGKNFDTIKVQVEFDNVKAKWFEADRYVFMNQLRFAVGDFNQQLTLSGNFFKDNLSFLRINFNSMIIDSSHISFETYAEIWGNEFERDLKIEDSNINTNIYYEKNLNFGLVSFNNSIFNKKTVFDSSTFRGSASFRNCKFMEIPRFSRISFYDTLDLTSTSFERGIDFRRCNFDSVKKVIFEGTDYPIGKLMIEWDDIKERDEFVISLDTLKSDAKDEFKRLVQIYEKLKYNYLEQGNKNSADKVSYELETRKQELIKGVWHGIYGLIFGYGYDPLRYIGLVLIIMLYFAWRLYKKHYKTVFEIMDKGLDKENPTIERKYNLIRLPIYYQNFTGVKKEDEWIKLSFLTIFWHTVFMSTSLLIGLRFKRNWIHKYDRKFLRLATIEWFLGVGLYIGFIILVKGQRFEFLKGIFGV